MDRLAVHLVSGPARKEPGAFRPNFQPPSDEPAERGRHPQHPVLASLAVDDAQLARGHVEVTGLKSGDLRDSQASVEHQGGHAQVLEARGVARVELGQQRQSMFVFKDAGKFPRRAHGCPFCDGVR